VGMILGKYSIPYKDNQQLMKREGNYLVSQTVNTVLTHYNTKSGNLAVMSLEGVVDEC
jgi:hypothetical protein